MGRLTRAQQQARTRSLLLESAAGLFAERGFDATSVEQIAETAGFSKGAFYSNFKSKEDIAICVLGGPQGSSVRNPGEILVCGQRRPKTILTEWRNLLLESVADSAGALLRAELLLRSARDEAARAAYLPAFIDSYKSREQLYHDLFRQLQRPVPPNAPAIAAMFMAVIQGHTSLALAGLELTPLQEVLDLLLDRLVGETDCAETGSAGADSAGADSAGPNPTSPATTAADCPSPT